jgi:hypothetical protein
MSDQNQVHPMYPMESTALDPQQAKSKASHYPYADPDYGQPYTFDADFKGPIK